MVLQGLLFRNPLCKSGIRYVRICDSRICWHPTIEAMCMKALIVIDYSYDFVADDGALTVGAPAQALSSRICDLTRDFLAAGDFVVVANDTHHKGDPYHPETKLFPPHNIEGTPGQKLYGEMQRILEDNIANPNLYYMPKTRYSAFAGTDLAIKLRERGITELHLVGVCTDICVLHTAVDAYNQGFSIIVHKQGVASFDPQGHAWALGHFEHCLGAKIVD